MTNGKTNDQIPEEEVTDDGFGDILSRLEDKDFARNPPQQLVVRANKLAGDDFARLLRLRRALIANCIGATGNNTQVMIKFTDENGSIVMLSI